MLKQIRQLHLYLGTFFAPAIMFFCLTGALQTFGLHENKNGAVHPAWIAKLAEIHKDQRFSNVPPKPPARPANATPKPDGGAARPAPQGPSPLPLKIFVLFMAVGLITTSVLGIYMAFKYNRDKRVIWGLLAAGTLFPVVLLFI